MFESVMPGRAILPYRAVVKSLSQPFLNICINQLINSVRTLNHKYAVG